MVKMWATWPWIFVTWALLLQGATAVNRGDFKTCDQSAFCKRQRATQPGVSPWELLLDTLNSTVHSLQVEVVNSRTLARLQLQLVALADSTLRIQLDELIVTRPRYKVEHSLAGEPQTDRLELLEKTGESVSAAFGPTGKVVLLAKPFRLDVFEGDQLVVSVNARGLLNFEHHRTRKSRLWNAVSSVYQAVGSVGTSLPQRAVSWLHQWLPWSSAAPSTDEGAGDPAEEPAVEAASEEEAAAPPEEEPVAEAAEEAAAAAAEDEDEPGMWEETFKSHTDSKPFGPTSVGVDVSFPAARFVYGIPEHADNFALKSTKNTDPYRLYNTDVFEYELYNPMALYGAVPFMVAKSRSGAAGVFWNNAAETWVDVGDSTGQAASDSMVSSLMNLVAGIGAEPAHKETHWFSESGLIDVFVMVGPTPRDVSRQYARLTGVTPLPQRFALGYHQCRWNYNDQEDVHQVDLGFDQHDIPYDVLWLDIEHTDGKKYFTWDPVKFPEPLDMVQNLTAKGRKLVTIVDPHMKRDAGFFFHQECEKSDFYVKNKDGRVYEGWCWPGAASYPDFFNPAVRDYWASRYALDKYEGTTLDVYTWNDMNEPSVFNGPEVTMPKDCLHYGGFEHRDVHNLYGMLVVEGTVRGQLARSQFQRRPFVLSRSFFAGSQRLGAVWTGDNMAEWPHLAIAVPMLLSLSVAGVPFCGADVGGFFNSPDSELLVRWYQAGAFQPFFRGHAHLHSKRREPWLFDERTNQLIKAAIKRRYSYLPLWYTLFHQHQVDGAPPMRPLFMEYPLEEEAAGVEDEHLVGDALLVHPVVEPGVTSVRVYLPGAADGVLWYDVSTWQAHAAAGYESFGVTMETIPVFQRGGSIVAKKERARRSTTQMASDPYTLHVALDAGLRADGRLYVDDGQSLEYDTEKRYRLVELRFDAGRLDARFADDAGVFESDERVERVLVAGWPRAPRRVLRDDGSLVEFQYLSAQKVLVLRKPDVYVTQRPWSLTIE